jgi:hypothetical protein
MRILAFLLFCLTPSLLLAEAFTVKSLQGTPKFRAKGQFKVASINVGDELAPGGRIKMAEGDALALSTSMGDEIELSGKTYMKLEALSQVGEKSTLKLELFQGLVSNKVHSLKADSVYQVRTPSAVAGVRGTEFTCLVDESGETEIVVDEGEVAVADADGTGEGVSVSAGQKASVNKTGGIEVKTVENQDNTGDQGASSGSEDSSSSDEATNEAASEATEAVVEEVADTVQDTYDEEFFEALEEASDSVQIDIEIESIER